MNTLLTNKVIAREFARLLKSNIVYPMLVDKRFEADFNGKVGDTITIRKRNKLKPTDYNGVSVEKQDINESGIPVKLDRFKDLTIQISSKDRTLSLQDYSKQVLEPIAIGYAEQINQEIAAFIVGNAGTVVAKTDNPNDLKDIAKLSKALDIKKAPKTERSLVFSTEHVYDYLTTDILAKTSYAGTDSALRKAETGELFGMMTYQTQDNPTSDAVTAGNITAFKVTGNAGESKVQITEANAATATLKKGDKFIVGGHLYTIKQDVQCASNAASNVQIEEKLHATIETATSVVVVTKPTSVAFHKEAVAFVNVPLELPTAGVNAYVYNDETLSIRVTEQYDMNLKSDVISFDLLFGLAVENKDLIVKLA